MRRVSSLVACWIVAASACGDGQAGDDYRGEALMTLRGVVTSSSVALTRALVPGLVLPGGQVPDSPPYTEYFIRGEVEGTFPSAFTLRLFEPPPEAQVRPMVDIEGEAKLLMAEIAAFSPEHPKWLHFESYTEQIGEALELGSRLCADTGRCLSGLQNECVPGEFQADAPWPCGGSFPDDLPWETYGYVRGYWVAYLSKDCPAGSVWSDLLADGRPIRRGYHLMKHVDLSQVLSPAELEQNNQCITRAADEAFETVNRIHGTNLSATNENFADSAQLHDWFKYTTLNEHAAGCRIEQMLVDDTASQPIELAFTDQPQRLGW